MGRLLLARCDLRLWDFGVCRSSSSWDGDLDVGGLRGSGCGCWDVASVWVLGCRRWGMWMLLGMQMLRGADLGVEVLGCS